MTRLTLMLALAASGPAFADVEPADVVFDEYGAVEEPLTDQPGDPAAGKEVMTTRGTGNCIACHHVTALEEFQFLGNVGPSLDGIGGVRAEAELRGIVTDAKHTFPGSMMPSFYKTSGYIRPGDAFTGKAAEEPLPPLLTGQQIEDVVAYLMTLTE
jgi:L-cysteine S-thiosulfotransferase